MHVQILLPVVRKFFARILASRRRPVAGSSRRPIIFFISLRQTQKKLFCLLFKMILIFCFTFTTCELCLYFLGYVYTGPVRNGSGPIFRPYRPSVYTGPFWNRSGTDPKLDLLFCRSSIGSDPDRFQKGPV